MIFIDLNILISTIIASTAALVAIIGGFLVSRVITLSSEKNSIVRRLREINNEMNNKKEMLDRVELILFKDDVDDFIENHAEEILIERKSINTILEENPSIELTEEDLKPYTRKLFQIFEDLTSLIEKTDDEYVLPNTFDEFAKDSRIKVSEYYYWYEIVYWVIMNIEPKQPSLTSIATINLSASIPDPSMFKTANSNSVQMYQDQIKERNSLQGEVQIISGMKKEQEKILKDYGKVSGLWSGLAVLIYACIVGIVIPSILLPYPLETYDDINIKIFLLTLFFSELVALFLYLSISMYKLTKEY